MISPYITSGPVSGTDFYGRGELIAEITGGRQRAFYVLGARQTGKTSLLHQIDTLVPAFCFDVQWAAGRLSDLVGQAQWELEGKRERFPWLPALEAVPDDDLFTLLRKVNSAAAKAGQTLWLLVDETEGLLSVARDDPSVFDRLRGTVQNCPKLRTVLVAAKTLSEANDLPPTSGSPFLSGFALRYLSGLSGEAAVALLRQSQSDTFIEVDDALATRIVRLTNGHPLLLQLLGERLFTTGRLRPPTDEDLAIIDDKITRSDTFSKDFAYLSDGERAIVHVISDSGQATGDQLEAIADHTFLHGLTQLGYLRRESDHYAVGNTFFARWLQESADWEQKSEISDKATLDVMEGSRRVDKIKRLANLMRQRKAAGEPPYVLVLGAGATLSSGCRAMRDVVQEVVGHYDLKQFYEILDNLSETERYARLQQFFQEPYPSPGYRHIAELAKAGYFDVVLSTNFDFLLENAFAEVGLRAGDVEVLVNGRESEDYILKALERRTPRIKLLKLHGDLKARNMAFTPQEIFAFSQKVERVLVKYLNGDVIIVGHEMRDDDINRCIRKDGGTIWYVHPGEPAVDSFIWRAMQVRPSTAISGESAQFDNFCEMLYKELLES